MQVEELTQYGECNQVKFQTKFERQTVDGEGRRAQTLEKNYTCWKPRNFAMLKFIDG